MILGLLLLFLLLSAILFCTPTLLNKKGWFGKNSVFGSSNQVTKETKETKETNQTNQT